MCSSENFVVAKPSSDLMIGSADILAAGIAYFVTSWKPYLTCVGSIGVFSLIAGLITVQNASFAPTKPVKKKSRIKEISSVAKRFFNQLAAARRAVIVMPCDRQNGHAVK